MKKAFTLLLLLGTCLLANSQQADFIVIKKKNNRTLKTYSEGSFLMAETYTGFKINGNIIAIRNDSIIVKQEETRLMATEFGSRVDTLSYTIGLDYRQVKKFNFGSKYTWGRKKGFASVTVPKLMIIGGVGFAGLELINSAYRSEPLNQKGKLLSLGIAAGVATGGVLWNVISKQRDRVGGRYKVVYVKATTAPTTK